MDFGNIGGEFIAVKLHCGQRDGTADSQYFVRCRIHENADKVN